MFSLTYSRFFQIKPQNVYVISKRNEFLPTSGRKVLTFQNVLST